MASTIAAIATAQTVSGLGVIRVSGENAIQIANKIVKPMNKKPLTELKGYTAAYSKVVFENETIDECVALVFRAPKSYTGEDVVEISCHGGLFVLKNVLRAMFASGAVPAQAGEFTKRAFLNGKMDLSEAEAVMKLIHAHSEQGAKAALSALDGNLSKKISQLNQILIETSAQMGAWVDYPDDEIDDLEDETLIKNLKSVKMELTKLLSKFDSGQILLDGIDTVIVGKPNVGKSAIMNLLSGQTRSIVTDIAGTTRDVIENTVVCGGVTLRLADTAGIRETADVVESIGVQTAKTRLERATLILAVFDCSRELSEQDEALFEYCRDKKVIAIINKTDLEARLDFSRIENEFEHIVQLSAKVGDGESELAGKIEELLGTSDIDTTQAMLTTQRQRLDVENALVALDEAIGALEFSVTRDAVNVCIDDAIGYLLAITGEKASEAVINEVFSSFCVGK